MLNEHPFAQYIRILGKGKTGSRSLSEQEAYNAFQMILKQQVKDMQIGAFLMLLRVKEESIDELVGFVRASRDEFHQSNRYDASLSMNINIDWPSYAGKRKHYPWFILSALTLARHNYRVFMHGIDGHTVNRLYTEQVLQFLDYPLCKNQTDIQQQLDKQRFAYVPLKYLSPVLADLIQLRSLLGLRSPIHTLVRLLNPFNAPATLQSIFHPSYRTAHQQTAYRLGYQNNAVIKGEGGEFERNPDAKTLICGIKHGECYEYELAKLTTNRSEIEKSFDLNLFKNVWLGKQEHDYGEIAVIETLQIALYTMNVVDSYPNARRLAEKLWRTRWQ